MASDQQENSKTSISKFQTTLFIRNVGFIAIYSIIMGLLIGGNILQISGIVFSTLVMLRMMAGALINLTILTLLWTKKKS